MRNGPTARRFTPLGARPGTRPRAVLAAVSILVVGVALLAACSSDDTSVDTANGPTSTTSAPADGATSSSAESSTEPTEKSAASSTTAANQTTVASGGFTNGEWERLPASPLSWRQVSVVAWTGKEILMVGGNDFRCPPTASCVTPEPLVGFTDGAAFNPSTRSWRSIAESPEPIWSGIPAVVGGKLFIMTFDTDDESLLLAYDIAGDSWTVVDLPEPKVGDMLAATDDALVVYPQSAESGRRADWLYYPEGSRWQRLPDDPSGNLFDRQVVWDGSDLYRFGKLITPSPGGASGPAALLTARLAGDRWEELAEGPVLGGWDSIVAGSQIIFPILGCSDGGDVNGYGECIPYGGVFDTDRQEWVPLPDANDTDDSEELAPIYAGATTGTELLLSASDTWYLDTASGEWRPVPPIDGERFGGPVPADESPWWAATGVGPYGFAFGGIRWGSGYGANGKVVDEYWLWKPSA